MPATKIPQPDAGIKTLAASLPEIATDMLGETSPMIPLAIKIPMGPRITSALTALYTTAFSPVAPRTAPAFSMALVASTFVPTASSSQSAGSLGSSSFASCAPMPPPCPSMIKIRFIPYIPCRYMPCRCSGSGCRKASLCEGGQGVSTPFSTVCATAVAYLCLLFYTPGVRHRKWQNEKGF